MQLMSTQSGGRMRVTSDRLLPLYDVGRHALWPALQPRRGRRREDDAPAGSTGGLRGLRGGLVLARHPWSDDLGFPLPWGPQEAVSQEIEVCTAKHLPLQHFEAIDVAFDRAVAPGQREPCFDGGIVVAQPLRKTLQGRPRTGRGAGEPAIEALRLAGPHALRKAPGQRDRLSQLRLLRGQQSQLLFLVKSPSLRPPEHEPGGSPRREAAVLGFRDERERRRCWGWLAGCQPLRLSETLGIAGHGGIAASVALLLEAMKHLPGVMTALVAVLEQEVFVGVQDAVPAPFIGALRTGGAAEIPQYRRLTNV